MNTGVHNLLTNCAGVQPSERVLIVQEDPALGWYDESLMTHLTLGLRKLNITPTIARVGGPGNEIDPQLSHEIATHDCTIYLARIGDQDRFGEAPVGTRSVMCYVRDELMLNSPFCTTDYRAFKQLKQAIDQVFTQADSVQIHCALGTELAGEMPTGRHTGQDDVSVLRFPLGVPTPVLADTFSGKVALANYLTPTGNHVYEPPWVPLPGTTFANVDHGAITGFTGDAPTVNSIRHHYDKVSTQFGVEAMSVHSFHAGMHPGCTYGSPAADNPDRWSNTVFCNPHFLHFHTCGQTPPGEICWMVRDPTIRLDDVALWEDGQLMLDSFGATRTCIDQWPELDALAKTGPVPLGL